jgi:uncharacterized protein YecT (DUF1311 family)
MRLIFFLLVPLAACLSTFGGAMNAAEIEVVPGIDSNQKVILIRGVIEEGDDRKFFEIAETTPRAIVFLESSGGLVSTGISIAAEISIRDYTTLVLDGSGCHSICAVIWVAGVRRYMSPDAKISVHAAYRMRNSVDGNIDTSESGMANAQIGAFLNEIGVSVDAIRYFTFASPSEDLLDITPEIAQALSIDVYIQTTNGAITPSERPTPRRITRQVFEYVALARNCAELFSVDAAIWNKQAKAVLDRGHQIFGGKIFAPLLGEYAAATKTDIRQQGLVRWCLSAEKNLRRDGLQTNISGPSYDCSRSSTRTEFAVCGTSDLWAMDRAMANLYFYYSDNVDASRSQEFLSSQRTWLSRRDQCVDDIPCLYERYSSRLFDFGN